jgi:beta-mannosidase
VQFSKKPNVSCTISSSKDGEEVVLKADAPVKGVMVSVPIEGGKDAVFEDNFVDLVPDEEVRLAMKGREGRKLEARWLCDWELKSDFKL